MTNKFLLFFLLFFFLITSTLQLYSHNLGSTIAITDNTTTVVASNNYLPYGSELDIPNDPFPDQLTNNTHQYTTKEIDNDIGLYYYGARYYNPDLGRFMSADPVGGNIFDPQSFNAYPYVLNNPFKYIDPDGEQAVISLQGNIDARNKLRNNLDFVPKLILDLLIPIDPQSVAFEAVLGPSVIATGIGKANVVSKFVFDARVNRFRNTNTGKFVARNALPFPSNNGFAFSNIETVSKGTIVDRFGSLSGRFVSEPSASISQRGLPPGTEKFPFNRFEVLKSIRAEVGPAVGVPEFGAVGGAKQILFDRSINQLIREGFLRVIP